MPLPHVKSNAVVQTVFANCLPLKQHTLPWSFTIWSNWNFYTVDANHSWQRKLQLHWWIYKVRQL